MQEKGILCGDFKPESLLFANNPKDLSLKLCDFGLRKFFTVPEQGNESKSTVLFSTAPEVIKRSACTFSSDVWSCGVLLYNMLCGSQPFHENPSSENDLIRSFSSKTILWSNLKNEKELIKKLLNFEAANRCTLEVALKDPWIINRDTLPNIELNPIMENLLEYTERDNLKKTMMMCVARLCSDDDIKNLRKIFTNFDKDGNGTLTYDELIKGISSITRLDFDIEDLKKIDIDNSGVVDYTEFLAATIDENINLYKMRIREAFEMFDQDDSKTISATELRQKLKKEGSADYDDHLWESLIKECSLDDDGEIDFKEFEELMKKKKYLATS